MNGFSGHATRIYVGCRTVGGKSNMVIVKFYGKLMFHCPPLL